MEVEIQLETKEDLMMYRHKQALTTASGKFCKPIPPRQPGELYTEYHRRVMAQLSKEAVACQEFMDNARDLAVLEAEQIFGEG